jgi:hypothetical protein
MCQRQELVDGMDLETIEVAFQLLDTLFSEFSQLHGAAEARSIFLAHDEIVLAGDREVGAAATGDGQGDFIAGQWA